MIKKITSLLLLTFIVNIVFGQQANTLIKSVSEKFSQVKNFKSNVNIDFDIPSINMEKMNGKVFYKAPNKFKVKLSGVAFLPKQNPFELYNLLRDTSAYVAVSNGAEDVSGIRTQVVSVLPIKEQDVVLLKCWINPVSNCIEKSQITTKSSGTITSTYFYAANLNYPLPYKINFSIDLTKFKIPKMIAVDINSKKKSNSNASGRTTGSITFNMSKYEINKGVKEDNF